MYASCYEKRIWYKGGLPTWRKAKAYFPKYKVVTSSVFQMRKLTNKQAKKLGVQMSQLETHFEEELRDTKYPHLRVATGGKGPPDGPVDNWLADLEVRTMFVARHRNSNDVDYNQYYVLFKSLPEVVLLKWILPDGKLLDYYVDPVRFSKMFPEHVILGVDKEPNQEPQQEAEVNHDSSE